MVRVGSTLKRLRKARDLKLTEVSRQSGVQLATLSRIENNLMTGSLNSYAAIAKVFGLKLSRFFAEYEKDSLGLKNKAPECHEQAA